MFIISVVEISLLFPILLQVDIFGIVYISVSIQIDLIFFFLLVERE